MRIITEQSGKPDVMNEVNQTTQVNGPQLGDNLRWLTATANIINQK